MFLSSAPASVTCCDLGRVGFAKQVTLPATNTEAKRLAIALGMWRAARRMIERIVAAENPDLTKQEQDQMVANRMSHGT